jgi:hypothetical protein
MRVLVTLYALLNAVLYSGLLPLWEGFDEPFHYGYVQQLSVQRRLPVLGETRLSREVAASLKLVPVSHIVRHDSQSLTFQEYFALPEAERVSRRKAVDHLPASLQGETAEAANYEAHQAPLAYVPLAIADVALAHLPLARRVFCLRVICSVSAAVLTIIGVGALGRFLRLSQTSVAVVLFCTFSSQMFWATTAHIANDWLAVPLTIWLLAACIRFHRRPGSGNAAMLGVVFSLGLLTKAYFLAFLPVVLGILIWNSARSRVHPADVALLVTLTGAIAAPWYLRNLVRYGTISGTVESVSGVGLRQAATAMIAVPWPESIGYMARASLWTGNNSFTTFSRATLNLILGVLSLGFLLYAGRLSRTDLQRGDAIVLAAVGWFCAGLVYVTATSFAFRSGASAGASPWYMQPLLAPVLCLIARGIERSAYFGRPVLLLLVLLSMYLICATYVAKLIPLYGGYDLPRASLAGLYTWYLHQAPELGGRSGGTYVASAIFLYLLTGAVVVLSVWLAVRLWWLSGSRPFSVEEISRKFPI